MVTTTRCPEGQARIRWHCHVRSCGGHVCVRRLLHVLNICTGPWMTGNKETKETKEAKEVQETIGALESIF